MERFLSSLARRGFEPNSLGGFAFSVGCIAAAAAIRWLLGMWFGATLYFAAFFPAVIIAALFAGFWPGMLALFLSVVLGLTLFVPANILSAMPESFIANLAIYLFAGLTTVWLGHLFRTALRQLQIEYAQREMILNEIQHRGRNMGAMGAAIVQFSLKDNREAADLINSRMRTLQATNDLITSSPQLQADLEDILQMECAPHGTARCILKGERVRLPSNAARTVALVIHELITNAVKYGALSTPNGKLTLSWTKQDDMLEIEWLEDGGPKISEPTRSGFGTKLIDTTVAGLGGSAVREFRENGFFCRVRLRLE